MSALCSYPYNCHHLFHFSLLIDTPVFCSLCVWVWIPLCSWHAVVTRLKHVLTILSSTTLEFWAIRKVTMEIHWKRWWWSHWNTSIYFSIYKVSCPIRWLPTFLFQEKTCILHTWPNSCVAIAACGCANRCTRVSDRLFRWSSVGPTQWRWVMIKQDPGDGKKEREGHLGEAPLNGSVVGICEEGIC